MNFTRSFPEPEIALLTLDCPGRSANVLSREVMAELADHLAQLRAQAGLRGLVIASSKPGGFALGADLKEMRAASHSPSAADPAELSRGGQQILRELCQGPLVSVAAIDGLCLGGGAELACWCDARVISTNPRSQIGLPEVKLGLIPGWGGTATLPRRVGLSHAVRMIASGEPIEPEQALALGLVDEVVAPEALLKAAIRAIRRRLSSEAAKAAWIEERKQFHGPLAIPEPERELLEMGELQTLARDGRSTRQAPRTAIRLMVSAASLPLDAALKQESAAFAPLRTSAEHQALLYSYFLTDYAKRAAATAGQSGSVSRLENLSIIGAGVMGGGIAAAALSGGLEVTLCDARPEALATAAREVAQEAAYDRRLRGPNPQDVVRYSARLHPVGQLTGLAGAPAVVEAIAENLTAKQQLYAELEPLLPETALLASNTSTLPITQLAATLKHPERFCGMHFFNPVRRMKLLEIVRGEQTSDATISAALALARQLGKLPIVVRDGPGFAVNRMLSPYLNESLALLHDGLSMEQVDAAAVAFGMPLGPLAIYDLVGLDVAIDCGKTFYQAFPDRAMPSPILRSLIRAGRLGRKQGGGFYRYDTKAGVPQRDPAAEKIVEGYRKRDRELTTAQIQDRLLFAMLCEAARVLEEGRVREPRDLDLGVTLGLGFPETQGGILFWADTLGGAEILRRLEPLRPLGAQFEPPQLLLDLAKSGRKLVADLGR